LYEALDASPVTIIVAVGTLMVTPLYFLATYVFSGASREKGLLLGGITLVLGAFMFWVCVSGLPTRLGLAGNLVVPTAWMLPTVILLIGRKWFLAEPLSQKWLVGLQLFRSIGAIFLLEMARGNVPGVFAYPAGIGDILVAIVAVFVLTRYLNTPRIPPRALGLVFAIGVADFLSAFFFGFFSSPTPLQVFFPDVVNNVVAFPTGLIPLFLVPFAILFHFLSVLNYLMHERGVSKEVGTSTAADLAP
jgi:hypothetical protein